MILQSDFPVLSVIICNNFTVDSLMQCQKLLFRLYHLSQMKYSSFCSVLFSETYSLIFDIPKEAKALFNFAICKINFSIFHHVNDSSQAQRLFDELITSIQDSNSRNKSSIDYQYPYFDQIHNISNNQFPHTSVINYKIQINSQKMDSIKTDEITSEQKQLELFAQNREHKFQQSLEQYLNHIKRQTEQLETTQSQADSRNRKISQVFEGVYERIMMGSQILSRKVKETSYQKKVFWENLIATNAEMNDLELKKDFYQQKRDAEDLYYDAIEAQKSKKISYTDLLGKMKADQSLKHWQQNNKKFQEKVTKGTKTLHQWKIFEEPHQRTKTYDEDNYDFIHQFTQSTPQNQWVKPIGNSKYTNNYGNSQIEDASVLKDFYHRKLY